ncbi:MAG: DinB family protein [Chloroflexota bacterium]|nr:DinB family protein [Chloroflexota bacterium]MDQ5867866.1 DinB family protein [Chloroflexota bacterium]
MALTMEDRSRQLEAYAGAYEQLTQALERYPREMWQYKSPVEDWSIHEVVVHITDSEANSYIRCRRLIAEPGEAVMAYDETRWATALSYTDQSTEDALQLFKWLRNNTYNLIKSLPESTWSHTTYHPENGTMTMDDWLGVYARHIPDHIEQMDKIFEEWRKL